MSIKLLVFVLYFSAGIFLNFQVLSLSFNKSITERALFKLYLVQEPMTMKWQCVINIFWIRVINTYIKKAGGE